MTLGNISFYNYQNALNSDITNKYQYVITKSIFINILII